MSGTNLGKMPILIVSLVIGIVMATTAIVPLVSDYSEAKTFDNDNYFRMSKITNDTDVTIEWDHTNPTIVTVDGENIDFSFVETYMAVSFVASDEATFRFFKENTTSYKIQKYGGTFASAGTAAETDVSIEINGFSISYTFGDTSSSATITEGYVIDPNGSYAMKNKDVSAYVKYDDSIICLAGVTAVDSTQVTIYATGSVEDGLTYKVLSGVNGVTYSFGDPTFNYVDVDGYVDLMQLSSVVFDFTRDTTTQTITYSYFIVPYEVTADPDNPDSYKALVKVIPVMAFVALIAAAAYMIYSKRD